MLSRIFWISIAGIALIAGIMMQDGNSIFRWHDRAHELADSHGVDGKIDRAIDRSFEKMHVTGPDGQEIEVPVETKRELASAVSRLVKAEAHLAMLRVGDGTEAQIEAAEARIDDARADIDRAKAQIKRAEQAAKVEHDAVREEVRREIREEVRDTVRDTVGG